MEKTTIYTVTVGYVDSKRWVHVNELHFKSADKAKLFMEKVWCTLKNLYLAKKVRSHMVFCNPPFPARYTTT